MGKKLNNYVRFPLILGVTCLLCGGALAGVNFITSPIIKENNDKKANQSLDDILRQKQSLPILIHQTFYQLRK